MKRLTSDKPVAEMRMFELAYNSCYIKDGKVRYRDYSLDEDARLLARRLLKDHADGDDAFTSDEDFDDWIVDCLQDGMDSTEGLIALFYRNLCAMADLREALKAYEDTGLSSEQIVEMDNLYAEKCREVAELKGRTKYTYETTRFNSSILRKIIGKLKEYKDLEGHNEERSTVNKTDK